MTNLAFSEDGTTLQWTYSRPKVQIRYLGSVVAEVVENDGDDILVNARIDAFRGLNACDNPSRSTKWKRCADGERSTCGTFVVRGGQWLYADNSIV